MATAVTLHEGAAKTRTEIAAEQLAARNAQELELARSIKIESRVDFENASAEMVRLKTLLKEADNRFDPIITKTNQAHKEAIAQKRIVTDPLIQAVAVISPKCAAWLELEEQQRQAEQRRLLEQAREAAELQREEAIQLAEAAGADGDEVEALCNMPLDVAPVTLARTGQTSAPVIKRESYRAQVENKLALLVFVAKNPTYLALLEVNQKALNGLAASLKSTMSIPGVKVVREIGTATYTAPRGGAR